MTKKGHGSASGSDFIVKGGGGGVNKGQRE